MKPIEPAGYFDSGTTPFYYQADIDRLQSDINALHLALRANKEMLAAETTRADKAEKQCDELRKALKWAVLKVVCKPYEWSRKEDLDAHLAAIKLIASGKGDS